MCFISDPVYIQIGRFSLLLKGGWNVEYVGRAILRVTSMNVSMSELQRLFRVDESVNGKLMFRELLLLLINVYFVLVKINKIEDTQLLRLLRRFFHIFRLSHVNPNVWRRMCRDIRPNLRNAFWQKYLSILLLSDRLILALEQTRPHNFRYVYF